MSDDLRQGDRRIDMTLCLHLDGDDKKLDTGAVVTAVEELLVGSTVYAGPMRRAFVIDSVDDPIHLHSVVENP